MVIVNTDLGGGIVVVIAIQHIRDLFFPLRPVEYRCLLKCRLVLVKPMTTVKVRYVVVPYLMQGPVISVAVIIIAIIINTDRVGVTVLIVRQYIRYALIFFFAFIYGFTNDPIFGEKSQLVLSKLLGRIFQFL